MKIKFLPTGQEIEATPQESLLKICTKNGIEIKSVCHGVPSCAECRVKIVSGENSILPPSKAELALIGSSYYLDGRRLSCQVRAYGDITVDITEQLERVDQGNKKMKGARALGKGHDLKATQSTLVLSEKTGREHPSKDSKSDTSAEESSTQEGTENSNTSAQKPPSQGSGRNDRNHRNQRNQKDGRENRDPRAQRAGGNANRASNPVDQKSDQRNSSQKNSNGNSGIRDNNRDNNKDSGRRR